MLLTALLATLLFTESQTQSIEYIADNLDIRTDVVSNLVGGSSNFTSKVTLTNNGGEAIEQSDWRLYFMSIHMVEPRKMLWKTGNGYEIPDSRFRVYHIAGCLFRFEPTSSFNGIPAGGSATITLTIQNWNVARTDNMPNWFITDSSGNNNMTIKSTATEDLKSITGNYDTANQWKRYEGDKYDPWTPEQRWEMNEIIDFGNASNNIAIPTPMRVARQGGKPAIIKPLTGWTVTGSDELRNEVDLLKATIGDPTAGTGGIQLQIDQEASSNHEGYKITIDGESNEIVISSPSPAGIFYGCQTFLSVYDDEAAEIPSMIIEDEPRYGYRGMHVDVARHFLPVEDMIKLIKVMGMYKLNKLHFHLTDDEGWRVEMPWCPYLTTTGATQCFDPNQRTCQFPQFGSRPDGQDRGSGSYSAEDYKQILSVARDNHVEVIPEVDMPGHARAAIKATKAFLESGDDDDNAAAIQLVDENDTSQYLSVQLYTDNAVDPCLNSTYEFVRKTVSTFLDYHSEIQPLRVMHVGGDEVADGAWVNSSACQRNGDVNTTQLAEEFVFRVSQIVNDLNSTLSLGLWEDGAISDEKPFDLSRIATDEVLVHSWQNIWEWGVASRAYKLANAGYKVIMSQATHLYFDHPQEPDPEERGFYWATRYSNIRKTFGFKPDDLYANIDVDRAGNPLEKDTLCKTEECVPLDPSSAHNIIGMQGHVWTETMRTSEQVFDAVFPRMLAMAERAWHKADWESDPDPTKEMEDWTSFANTLGYKELERLERMGISYRIPVPGAKSTNNGWVANIQFPGLAMTYATSDKPNEWKTYDAPVAHKGVVRFRAHSKDNSRTSRVISTSSSPTIQIHVLAIMFSIVALYLAMQF